MCRTPQWRHRLNQRHPPQHGLHPQRHHRLHQRRRPRKNPCHRPLHQCPRLSSYRPRPLEPPPLSLSSIISFPSMLSTVLSVTTAVSPLPLLRVLARRNHPRQNAAIAQPATTTRPSAVPIALPILGRATGDAFCLVKPTLVERASSILAGGSSSPTSGPLSLTPTSLTPPS